MRTVIVDCTAVQSELEFWDAYVRVAKPEGAGYFGRNLDAFWDALNGGPGWPGECELCFTNTEVVRQFRDSYFFQALCDIAARSTFLKVEVQ